MIDEHPITSAAPPGIPVMPAGGKGQSTVNSGQGLADKFQSPNANPLVGGTNSAFVPQAPLPPIKVPTLKVNPPSPKVAGGQSSEQTSDKKVVNQDSRIKIHEPIPSLNSPLPNTQPIMAALQPVGSPAFKNNEGPVIKTAAPPATEKEQKELEERAKQMVKELDSLKQETIGGGGSIPIKTPSALKAAVITTALLVVGLGTFVGIRLLNTRQTTEQRSQAGYSWCSNPVNCGGSVCLDAHTAAQSCHEAGSSDYTGLCWNKTADCSDGSCLNGGCGQLPPPNPTNIPYCGASVDIASCTGMTQCIGSYKVYKQCPANNCWKELKDCTPNLCYAIDSQNADCGGIVVQPSPSVPPPTPLPTISNAPWPNCSNFSGTGFNGIACGGCNDGNDPRGGGATGYGCNSSGILTHCTCPGLASTAQGCGHDNGTCTDHAAGTVTFSQNCGLEQIDTTVPGFEHSSISITHEVPCLSPTPTSPPVQPTNTPRPSATPTPIIQPSVTPTPIMACSQINYSSTNPNFGDTVTLTCGGTPTGAAARAEFQFALNNGVYADIANTTTTTARLTINQIGHYNVRCRVCRDATATSCTAWQGI
jgi:hypothetical protein